MKLTLNMLRHWKLAFHLVFGTRRFGVNDQWYAHCDSIFALPWGKRVLYMLLIYPYVRRFREVCWRMGSSVGFVPSDYFEK